VATHARHVYPETGKIRRLCDLSTHHFKSQYCLCPSYLSDLLSKKRILVLLYQLAHTVSIGIYLHWAWSVTELLAQRDLDSYYVTAHKIRTDAHLGTLFSALHRVFLKAAYYSCLFAASTFLQTAFFGAEFHLSYAHHTIENFLALKCADLL